MDPQLITKRIGAVETSTASIVGTAAWCALHTADIAAIVAEITSRMQSPTTAVPLKCSLLFVLHEILLSCAMSGVSETGRQLCCAAISGKLPLAIRKVLLSSSATSSASEVEEFKQAVQRVTAWWRSLNLFPKEVLVQMRAPTTAGKKGEAPSSSSGTPAVTTSAVAPSTNNGPSAAAANVSGVAVPSSALNVTATGGGAMVGVPPLLQTIARLLLRYEGAKETHDRLTRSNGSTAEAIDAAREEATRRLIVLVKALDGRAEAGTAVVGSAPADGSSSLLAKLHEELAALQGSAASAPPAVLDEADDILGSFF